MTRELDEALYGVRSLDDGFFAGDGGKMILDSPDYGSSWAMQPTPTAPDKGAGLPFMPLDQTGSLAPAFGGTVVKGGGIPPSSYNEPFLGGSSTGGGTVQTGYAPPQIPTVERPITPALRNRGIRICVCIYTDGHREVLR